MSGTIVPILVIMGLGAFSSVIVHRHIGRGWPAVVLSAGIATMLWIGGTLLLLLITAPNELRGGILWRAFFYTYLVAMFPAVFVFFFKANTPPRSQS